MTQDETVGPSEQDETWLSRLRRSFHSEPESREELRQLFKENRWKKLLDPDELAMLQGALEVSQGQVRDIMVPRSQMVVLEKNSPLDDLLRTIVECGHSRFPVVGEDRDEIVGILLAKDVLRYFSLSRDTDFDINRLLRPATFIPESKRLNILLKEFRNSRNHMAIVVDEYGGIAGLLTIEDVLEEIVGEIDDEHDPREAAPIERRQDGRFHVRALTRIEDFNEFFECSLNDDDYDTVAGLVMHELGRLPRRGESVFLSGFRFKVLQADRRRVYAVEVTPSTDAAAGT